MSAREWQPGDRAYVEVEVLDVEAFGEDEPMPLQTLLAAARDVGVKITGHERAEGV